MKRLLSNIFVVLAALGLLGCEQATDKVGSGGVILSVSDFDGLPISWSVAFGSMSLGQITIDNIAKNPTQGTSSLMNVEMQSYEVTFSRADTGSILPPPLVNGIFGVAPVDGSETYDNLPLTSVDQMQSRPLSDLLLINGGFDKETGEQFVRLNLHVRFFGKTLSGDPVSSAPVTFTVTFTR